MVKIRLAGIDDIDSLDKLENNSGRNEISKLVECDRYYIISDDNIIIGWLRYGLFWDHFPIMNMLYLNEGYRRMVPGTKLAAFWESEMQDLGYDILITSTQADEEGRHFYRRMGYKDVGSFLFPGQEASELILIKELKGKDSE